MLVEAITLKLAVDLFEFLRKNAIIVTDIKIKYFDRSRNRYRNFSSLDDLKQFYTQNYTVYDKCSIGELVSIEYFKATSNLYTFNTSYIVTDVSNSTKIINGFDYDKTRMNTRQVFIDRQKSRLQSIILSYKNHFGEVQNIFLKGIFSPCYAQPGWSEGTARLEELRMLLTNNKSIFK